MKRFSFSSLRVRLMILVFFAIIPALGLMVYTTIEQRRYASGEAQEDALRLTKLTAGGQERWLEGARQLLVTLAHLPAVYHRDSAKSSKFFSGILKHYPHYANLYAAAPNGDIFCSAVPLPRPINSADLAWFQRAMKSRDFAIGDYQIGRIVGKPVLVVSYPILDEAGQIQGVVSASMDLAWLNQFAAQAQLPKGAGLLVIDRKGTILTRYPDPEKWVGKNMRESHKIQEILTLGEGVGEGPGVDGISRLYAFSPVRGGKETGMYVSVGISTAVAFAEINRNLARNLVGLGLVAILAFLAAWFVGDILILRQVNTLVKGANRLASGDLSFQVGPPYKEGELGQLGRSFDEMVKALEKREAERKQAEEELQKSATQWRTTFDTVKDSICLLDENQKIQRLNKAMTKLFKKDFSKIIGHHCWEIVHGTPEPIPECPILRMQKTLRRESTELMVSDNWYDISVDPILDGSGSLIGAVHIIRDITERKRAEEQLKESEERYRSLFYNSIDAVLLTAPDGSIFRANPEACRLFGYTEEELLQFGRE